MFVISAVVWYFGRCFHVWIIWECLVLFTSSCCYGRKKGEYEAAATIVLLTSFGKGYRLAKFYIPMVFIAYFYCFVIMQMGETIGVCLELCAERRNENIFFSREIPVDTKLIQNAGLHSIPTMTKSPTG